ELADEYRERGADVQLTGPWPPYNFVKSSIEAAR
ncbi:MAG: protein gvpF, partial [Actinobacteria bacterium]